MSERLQESSEALVELQTDLSLAATRAAAHNRQCDEPWAADFDGEHCIDCDVELPLVRLNYGCVRCVTCQTVTESKSAGQHR